ncbi:MAG: HAD family hydrolase [Deltaproteobacteria bacterium]|nr:HAD family hydrolase [Deltaproteobacteria bacterium]
MPNRNNTRAIIFDVSGTLMDDIRSVWQANADAYRAYGIGGFKTLEEFRERIRLPIAQFHRDNNVPPHLMESVDRKFREIYPVYAPLIDVFPEVAGVLAELQSRNILLGVVSSIPTQFLSEHLQDFALDRYFTALIGQEDCDEQKPSPKPLLAALDLLGVDKQDAMYVGDMEEDMMAAKAAGITATAITRKEGYHSRRRLEKQKPDYFISDLNELLFV